MFKNPKFDAYLCAEGIISEKAAVHRNEGLFDDYLFCIHLQRQYSAAKELDDFLAAHKDLSNPSASTAKILQALEVHLKSPHLVSYCELKNFYRGENQMNVV